MPFSGDGIIPVIGRKKNSSNSNQRYVIPASDIQLQRASPLQLIEYMTNRLARDLPIHLGSRPRTCNLHRALQLIPHYPEMQFHQFGEIAMRSSLSASRPVTTITTRESSNHKSHKRHCLGDVTYSTSHIIQRSIPFRCPLFNYIQIAKRLRASAKRFWSAAREKKKKFSARVGYCQRFC